MELESVLDKDLQDDMLKLVRYKVLFVRREYEFAFPEREALVSENMDGDAFTAWKVAEFIQELAQGETPVPKRWNDKLYPPDRFRKDGNLLGLPDEDKKYLRIYFEVLDRYPREKFKYEEQQIRVLEQIRDNLPMQAPAAATDPYAVFQNYLNLSSSKFAEWRQGLRDHASSFGHDLAAILNKYNKIGAKTQFTAPKISEDELSNAFSQENPPFNRATFDRFTGKTADKLILFAPGGQPPTTEAPPGHSWWAETVENNGSYFQKITGSNYYHVDPTDTKAVLQATSKTQADLLYNVYTPELGITTWSMYRENHDSHLRSIGYEVNGKLFWFNEMLNPDLTKTLGPLPNVVPPQVVDENQYIISIDFLHKEGENTYFCVYAMHIEFDFDKGTAEFANRILELKAHLIK
jgi:hypothetical protein